MSPYLAWPWFAPSGRRPPQLEVITRKPAGRGGRTPLVFVHGAYVGAWCWDEFFLPYFAERGFEVMAPSLRGHGRSAGNLEATGIADYVDDLTRVVDDLDRPPVLIGHSMGGLVIQKYLERRSARAAVLMASVPPSGLMMSSLRLLLADPMLLTQLTLMQSAGPQSVDVDVARRAVFSDHIPAAELARYTDRMQSESQRALWEMTAGMLLQPWCVRRVPMLVTGAEEDSLFSTAEVRTTAAAYGADLYLEPGMAHAMMLEPGWRNVADHIIQWLRGHGLA
jgi:non-heme chloroperoxidase